MDRCGLPRRKRRKVGGSATFGRFGRFDRNPCSGNRGWPMSTPPEPRRSALLTARELAGMFGVSTETVLRWTRRRDLPAIRLPGGAIRFRAEEIEGWLENRATLRRGSVS